jgi:hypothetical protein|tara:strand:- start:193 stop:513 length:321 start_codon:yes stop_codon:yes gene_type:complete
MNTLTFNPSNWSGNGADATAEVTDLGQGDSRIIFRGDQFESSQYTTNFGETGGEMYSICDLSHEGNIVATAYKDGRDWWASEQDGDLTREDDNPLVALLQVVANIM